MKLDMAIRIVCIAVMTAIILGMGITSAAELNYLTHAGELPGCIGTLIGSLVVLNALADLALLVLISSTRMRLIKLEMERDNQ